MEFQTISTKRLILRLITPEVFDYIFEYYSDEQLMEFLHCEDITALEKEKSRYQKGFTMFNKSFLFFHILEKTTEKMIGWCGFHTWYFEHDRAEIGYILYADGFKGNGLMSEAIIPIIKYGFEEMNLNRIEAFVGPENVPSLKLMHKMNFVQEGYLRQHYKKNGVIEDSVVFSLLKEDYSKLIEKVSE